jgi:hypothetical protein
VSITQDATSLWFVPASTSEWTQLLTGDGISNPGGLWLFQDAASPALDSIGTANLAGSATGFQQAVTGWSRKAIIWGDGSAAQIDNNSDAGFPDLNTTSMLLLALVAVTNTPGTTRTIMNIGPGGAQANNISAEIDSSKHVIITDGSNIGTGAIDHGTSVIPIIIRYNKTASTAAVFADTEKITKTFATPAAASKGVWFGDVYRTVPALSVVYAAAWYGAAAEMSDVQVSTLITRIKTGPASMNVGVPLPVIGTDVPDHVAAALGRLLEQDKNKTNIAKLLTSLVTPQQDLESALWQLLTQRRITTAIGAQLDALGKLVGLARNGLSDTDYRVFIYVQIAVNTSRGRHEDLIAIAKLALQNTAALIEVKNQPVAQVVARVGLITTTDTLGSQLAGFLQAAAAAGVRVVTQWSNNSPGTTFTFDIGPGFDVGKMASTAG